MLVLQKRSVGLAAAGFVLVELVAAPAASAAQGAVVVAGFLGLPSLHSIIQGIASGFFGALAEALVPSFLRHGTVATIQHLVALPDPTTWPHVAHLQGEMVYLGATLLPLSLAVSTLRYWLVGLTGAAHPVEALGRCVWAAFALVLYPWMLSQGVAVVNSITHAILASPEVSDGLGRIVGILFGGALLTGTGSVFGAVLVIVAVVFFAGLFALQAGLTLVMVALSIIAPPFIGLAPINELAHLARGCAHALLGVALVPIGWTVLFASAGALCLDATSFTGGANGIPGHIEAAFAGLLTVALAVGLPIMLLGRLGHLLIPGSAGGGSGAAASSPVPGADKARAGYARLRSAAFDGAPAIGRSVGAAAGGLGAPAGGPLGAARRRVGPISQRIAPIVSRRGGSAGKAAGTGEKGTATASVARAGGRLGGVRQRLGRARDVLAAAPGEARAAMAARRAGAASSSVPGSSRTATGKGAGKGSTSATRGPRRNDKPAGQAKAASSRSSSAATGRVPRRAAVTGTPAARTDGASGVRSSSRTHPARAVSSSTGREAASKASARSRTGQVKRPAEGSRPAAPKPGGPRRKPRPGGKR